MRRPKLLATGNPGLNRRILLLILQERLESGLNHKRCVYCIPAVKNTGATTVLQYCSKQKLEPEYMTSADEITVLFTAGDNG
jgi:hypothetical protein